MRFALAALGFILVAAEGDSSGDTADETTTETHETWTGRGSPVVDPTDSNLLGYG